MLRALSPRTPSLLAQDPFLRAFDDLLRDPLLRPASPGLRPTQGPRVNGYRTEEAWHLVFEVPGFKADELEVKVEDGGLVVSGSHDRQAPEGARLLRAERPRSLSFSRRFTFPEQAVLDQVQATLKDGLLTLTVPRAQPAVRRIEVKAG